MPFEVAGKIEFDCNLREGVEESCSEAVHKFIKLQSNFKRIKALISHQKSHSRVQTLALDFFSHPPLSESKEKVPEKR